MDIPIRYEDNHLLIVEKPVNMLVQGDRSGDLDLLSALKEDIKERYQKPGNVYLGLVHRLDRPVGGLMVFAKTSKAASRLSDAIRRGAFSRSYLAVTRGIPQQKQATLENYLIKNHRENKVHAVNSNQPNAKKAILDYEVVSEAEAEDLSLLAVTLHTGRPHQIRVQLSTVGYPLYGDQKYGQDINKPGQQIALYAYKLSIEHPTTKEAVFIESTPPNEYPWNLWEEFHGN